MKKVIVLSLGGSVIVPEKMNLDVLRGFKKVILKNTKKYKFVVVCGGGSVARKYISALRELGIGEFFQSMSGISATRMNARFMSYIFKINPHEGVPHTFKTLKAYLRRQDVVFCGALEYKPHQTSDSTAVEIAERFKSVFINITNTSGLHDKDPSKYKNAKFIPRMTWSGVHKMATKMKFKPGQHFVLDQTATGLMLKHKITTYIIGKDMKELDNLLNGKKFKGTIISG